MAKGRPPRQRDQPGPSAAALVFPGRHLRWHRSAWDYSPLGVELKASSAPGGTLWSAADVVGTGSSVILHAKCGLPPATSRPSPARSSGASTPQARPRINREGLAERRASKSPPDLPPTSPARTMACATSGPSLRLLQPTQDLGPVDDEAGLLPALGNRPGHLHQLRERHRRRTRSRRSASVQVNKSFL